MRQIRTTFSSVTVSMTAALLINAGGFATRAEAATVPFTFEVTGQAALFGAPSAGMLDVPTTVTGSVSYNPFGTATYFETGLATFVASPSGEFGQFTLASVKNAFFASFPGTINTISGTNSVVFRPGGSGYSTTITIDGGTGIFQGASGGGTGMELGPVPPLFVSVGGVGTITAPGLNAVPEPGTFVLLGAGLAGLVATALKRRRV